jgi:hypothetical protein
LTNTPEKNKTELEKIEREMKNSGKRTKKQNENEGRQKNLAAKKDFIHLQAVKVMEICQSMVNLSLKFLMS